MKRNLIKAVLSNSEEKKRVKREKKYINSTRESIISTKASFETMEAYRAARTNLTFALVDEEDCKKVIFTSAMPGEGKSTICINLAITFAQTGADVLVIDTDLRRPRIHSYLDLANDEGISNVLVGLAQLDDVIKTKDGIDYITSGYIPLNPAELLSSKKMEEVIEELSKRYEYIFFDTPPVTVVTDAVTMSKLAAGVVFVVRQDYTMHRDVEMALSALKFTNAKILGFILNDAESISNSHRNRKYNYYYNYNNGYSSNHYGKKIKH